jgi:hypothetical protein
MTIKINVDIDHARAAVATWPAGAPTAGMIRDLCDEVERLYAEAVNAKQAKESMGRMATGAELQALREWIDREFKSTRDDIAASFKARDHEDSIVVERLCSIEKEVNDARVSVGRVEAGFRLETDSRIRQRILTLEGAVKSRVASSLEESRVDRILYDHERQKEAFLAMQKRLAEVEDLAKRIADRQVKGEQAVGGRLGDLERFRDGLGEVLEQRISRAQCEVIDYASESSKAVRRDVGARIDRIEQALGGAGADAQRDAWIARAEAHDLNKIEESNESLDDRMGAVEARLTPDPDQMPRINIHRVEVACDDPDRFAFALADRLKRDPETATVNGMARALFAAYEAERVRYQTASGQSDVMAARVLPEAMGDSALLRWRAVARRALGL